MINKQAINTLKEMKRIRILLIMSILTLCVPVCAQRKWDGVVATAFAGGTGTEYDPYLITNAGEFAFMLEQTRKGNDFNGKCIKFRNDIVFNATIESGKTFSGVLDGNGYYVHGANFSPEGIFGTLNGTIKNLMISDTKYGRYGFVTIISSTGKLINCNFSGNLRCFNRYDYYSDRYGFARTNQGVIANCAIVGSTDFHSGYQCTAYIYAYDNGNGVISNSYSKLYNTHSFRVYNFGPYGGTNSYSGSTENLTDSLDGLNNWVANHGGEYSTWVKGEQYPYQSIFAATRNEIHTVTFDANGGSVDEATRMTANGEAIGNMPVPVNGDMKFEGWYHGLELVDETYPIYGDMTLWAKWKKEIKRQPTPEDPSFVVSDADHAIYQWYKISGNNQDIDLAKCSAGAYPWTLQDDGSFRSGNAGIGGSSSTAEKTVAVKAGARLTLDYTVSSEKDYDYFDITWNGTTLLSASGSKSGTFEHVFTSDATGTLKFLYSKDSSGNSGSDCVTVRNCAICEPDIRIEGETTSTLNLSKVDVDDRVYCEVTYDNDETSILRSDTITIVPYDYLAMEDVTVRSGDKVIIPVSLKNRSSINSVGGIITLPEGMTIEQKTNGKYNITLNQDRASVDDAFAVSSNQLANGSVKFLLVSSDGTNISGNAGAIIYVPVIVDESLEGDYEVALSSVQLSDADAVLIDCPDVQAVVTVERYTPGDVNADGQIAPNDITLTIKSYLGENPSNFVFKAADMNLNGVVDPADITSIIRLYLSEGASAASVRAFAAARSKASVKSPDGVYLSDVTIEKGTEGKLVFSMDLKRDDYTSLGGIITIPDGFSFVTKSTGKIDVTKNNDVLEYHTVSTNQLNKSQMKFLIKSDDLDLIPRGLSQLISVKVRADEDVPSGEYTYGISSLQLSDYDANLYDANDAEGKISVPGATNPNTLTFVESDETSSRTNTVSHKSDGTYEASGIIISDEYEWPYFGYSISCDNVSFSRQTSDDYITLVLPYMFDCDNAYVLTKTGDDSMTFSSVKGGIEPYTPVLVKTNGKDVNIIGHDIVSTTVAGFHLSPVEGVEGWYRAYVTSETTVEDVEADETLSKYDVYEISVDQFVRVTKRMTIKPFRTVYLCERQGVASDIKRIILVEDGGTTFINRIENSGESEATYNTQGQRVSSSYRGIVLKNGRKNLSDQ